MILRELRISNFRCIEHATLQFDQRVCVIAGKNGAGKTSLIEAAYYLARGRSFRQPRHDRLIQHDQPQFSLYGQFDYGHHHHKVGISCARQGGHKIRIDGADAANLRLVAERLVVQVLEPEIHQLIADGPEQRRKFLDYGVFHVEPTYLTAWRRYKTALKQRNAALRTGASTASMLSWERALLEEGATVDSLRAGYVRMLAGTTAAITPLLGLPSITMDYRPGWNDAQSMEAALDVARERDAQQGTTSVGPHRADLRIQWGGRLARQQVSRGQQKLLAAALVLAQAKLLASLKSEQIVLLVDDPAAELDKDSLSRLMDVIRTVPGQLILTAIDPEAVVLPTDARLFHVEQGVVSPG
ncbi:MAG: DNA replication/repair protein RecF [Pseudomonadota bacterium]